MANNMEEDTYYSSEHEGADEFLFEVIMTKFPKNIRNRFIHKIFKDEVLEDCLSDTLEKYARLVKMEICFHLQIESNETDIYIEFIPTDEDVYDYTVLQEIHVNNEPKNGIHRSWKILSSDCKDTITEFYRKALYMDGLLMSQVEDKKRLVNLALFAHKRVFRVSDHPEIGES